MAVDVLDLIVLGLILAATTAYFTKGTLWAKPQNDKFAGGLGGLNKAGGLGGGSGDSSDRDIVSVLQKNDKNVVVFYGSQTGTAEDYASRLSKEASSKYGLKTMTADVEEYDFETMDTFPSDKVACFVLATYGEGEPTDSAIQFYEFLSSEDSEFSKGGSPADKPLSNLNYVIFGLGNNTYEHFNAMGRNVDKLLQNLGAHRVGPYGEGDDGNGTMEEDYLAWKDDLFAVWKDEMNLEEHEAVYEPALEISETEVEDKSHVFLGEPNKAYLQNEPKGPFGANNPYLAPVVKSYELFDSTHRNCIHLEINIGDSNLKYTTGDHLAFWTQNCDEEVDRFLSVLGLQDKRDEVINVKTIDPTAKVPFPVPTTFDTIVRYYLEINGPVSRQFVSSIAPFAPTEEAKATALKLGSDKELFQQKVTHRYLNTARLLGEISQGQVWDKVPFTFIIETLNHLQPRYYSISSSSLVNKDVISVTAVVESIKPETSDHVLKGVATNYILDLKQALESGDRALKYNLEGPRGKYAAESDLKVPVHVRHSNFKLPSSPKKPIIMIGPGTGVAPFRGFIHERAEKAKSGAPVGRAVLFFGSRTSTEDALYSREWPQYINESVSDNEETYTQENFLKVINAFSREGPKKVYVQHRMEENAELINNLLKQGAFFYVCGDANRMAREVQNTLAKIISQQRDIPLPKAEEIVKNMKTQNTYQEDVW